MTKERRLAIEMWTGIRDMLTSYDTVPRSDILLYKYNFCKQHSLNWSNNCWFCKYIPRCNKCPLKRCSDGLYETALADYKEKDVRIDACTNIVKALGGEI